MKVLVVGASGNIGTALLRRLAEERDIEVTGVARRAPDLVPPYDTVRWHEIDIGTGDAGGRLAELAARADAVVHLAWLIQPSRDEAALYRVNVEGSRRVFGAAADAGAAHLLYLSSIGAYSPGPKDDPVDESWPTGGVASSYYSRDKSAVERLLDYVGAERPELVVTRLRPGLVLQRGAASEIQRYFLGPFVPTALFRALRAARIPVLPLPRRLVLQFVHSFDVAEAILAALRRRCPGAFNLAAEPTVTPAKLAELVGARHVPVPERLIRSVASTTWALRMQPASAGWVDLAMAAPTLRTDRARRELGWNPRYNADAALRELFAGLAEGAGLDSPPLRPRAAARPSLGVPGG